MHGDDILWLPPGRRGFEPINVYALVEGSAVLLVDTGIAVHRDAILAQLRRLFGPRPRVGILLTRAEPDAQGNLPALLEACDVPTVYVGANEQGGGVNPFNYFDRSVIDARPEGPTQLVVRRRGDGLTIAEGRTLALIGASLRILNTSWVYDEATSTLFSSDLFGHVGLSDPAADPVSRTAPRPEDRAAVRDHLLTKFEWIGTAELRRVRTGLADLFRERRITRIAPTHGCVLEGDAVTGHVGLVLDVLDELDLTVARA